METQNKKSILRIPLLLLVCVVLFSFGVGAVSAANTSSNSTIYVSTDGDDTWDGLSPVYNTTSGPKKTIKKRHRHSSRKWNSLHSTWNLH